AQVPEGPLLRFFYQADPVAENASEDQQQVLLDQWERLPEYTIRAFEYMNEHFGQYPYDEYVVAQGGDGGMEYIMGTLITGNRDFQGLVGVTVHELVHAWYQGVLANNESYYHWMDEGFTVYASWRVMKELFGEELDDSIARDYDNYYRIVKAGLEEPMQRHADHFQRNIAYSIASYSKGAIFLHQLGYIIGREALARGMRRFYEEWAFRHPTGRDFIRTVEREAGIQLYWYYEYWVNSVRTIDYGIDSVRVENEKTVVHLRRHDEMPMPIDIEVERKDGSVQHHHIPLQMMWGHKENEFPTTPRRVEPAWPWVDPEYKLELEIPIDEIARIEIDPTRRMADVRRDNQRWEPVEPGVESAVK
ncbi:MAG: M1 family aminopeptidase, partial [Balneolaceae bacterium]